MRAGWFSRDPLQVFSAGGDHEQWCSVFDIVHPAFAPPTSTVPCSMVLERLWWRLTCRTMPVCVRCQLPEAVSLSCAPSRRYGGYLRHLVSIAWILFSESASRVHVSQPYRRREGTRGLCELNVLVKLMVPLHILFNLANAAIAELILMWISAELVPSLPRVAPRYLKVVISSNLWLVWVVSALMFFGLIVMILLKMCAYSSVEIWFVVSYTDLLMCNHSFRT